MCGLLLVGVEGWCSLFGCIPGFGVLLDLLRQGVVLTGLGWLGYWKAQEQARGERDVWFGLLEDLGLVVWFVVRTERCVEVRGSADGGLAGWQGQRGPEYHGQC